MFDAELVSLSSGQSYRHTSILQPPGDYETYGVPYFCNGLTIGFLCDHRCILANQWNLRVIHLDRKYRAGSVKFERLILDKDIVYHNGMIIENWEQIGIPRIISDELVQLVWSTPTDGTMISTKANLVSLILIDPRLGGTAKVVMKSATQIERARDKISPFAQVSHNKR